MNATILVVATLAVGVGASRDRNVVDDRVDLIEVNHVYDAKGEHVFDQTIFYEWSDYQNRYQVRAWRLLKQSGQKPVRDWKRGEYRSVWRDGTVFRRVRAQGIRETWTQYDPELLEREHLPRERRRELTTPQLPNAVTSTSGG